MAVVLAALIIAGAILYVGRKVTEQLAEFDHDIMCLLAMERTRLRIDLECAEMPVPEWLDEDYDDDEDEEGQTGQLLKLVPGGRRRKPPKGEGD